MTNAVKTHIIFKIALIIVTIFSTQAAAANIKIACVQFEMEDFDLNTNTSRVVAHLGTEAAQGTRIAVFPECALSGYSLTQAAGLTETQINDAIDRVKNACDQNDIFAVVGTPIKEGGGLYNSSLVIDPNGDIIYRQDKLFSESGTIGGDKPAIFEIDGYPATLFICHDERYPELMRQGVYGGAKIAFYIAFESDESTAKEFNYKCQIVGRAVENQTWTVSCNAPRRDTGNKSSHGQSRIIGPDGTIHVEAGYYEEVIRHTFDPDTSLNAWVQQGDDTDLLDEFWEEGLRVLQAKNPDYYPSVTADPCLLDDIGILGSSSSKTFNIACAQMKLRSSIATNATNAVSNINTQADAGADIIVFPECALTDLDPTALPTVDQNDIDTALAQVAAAADNKDVYVIIGSPFRENSNLYNGAYVFGPDGNIIKRHAQIHTDLPGVFTEGQKMSLFKIDDVVASVMVGHDIHFPELTKIAVLAGARICFYISYLDAATTTYEATEAMSVSHATGCQVVTIFCNAAADNDSGDSTGYSRMYWYSHPYSVLNVVASSASDVVIRNNVDTSKASYSYVQNSYNHSTFNVWWQEGLDIIRMNNPEFYGDLPVGFKELKVITDNWLSTTPQLPDYSSNLVAYWAFDENTGSYAYDSSVNSNTGTLYNMDSSDWVPGHDASALDFDGGNDYINVSDSDSISVGDGDYSISAWIYPHSISGNRAIVAKIKGTMDKEYAFSVGNDDAPDGGLILDVEYNTNNGAEYTNTVVTTGAWQHVMVTFDASELTPAFYHNFDPVPVSGGVGINALPRYFNDDLCIGRWGGSYNNKYFDGLIDEVKIYNCVVELVPVLPGDLDDNGIVDFNDFAIFALDWYKVTY